MKVIVSGFSNSGTSFLCNLIHKMGFSAGSDVLLKGADDHNRWGYWEHLGIRYFSWSLLGGHCYFDDSDWFPDEPLPRNESVANNIALMAKQDNVEVYKDCAIPIVYKSFPQDAKYVVIMRRPKDVYQSPKLGGFPGYACDYRDFLDGFGKYHVLVKMMRQDVDTLLVHYGAFKDDVKAQTNRIADFLDVTLDNPEEVYGIFKPRKALRESEAQRKTDYDYNIITP